MLALTSVLRVKNIEITKIIGTWNTGSRWSPVSPRRSCSFAQESERGSLLPRFAVKPPEGDRTPAEIPQRYSYHRDDPVHTFNSRSRGWLGTERGDHSVCYVSAYVNARGNRLLIDSSPRNDQSVPTNLRIRIARGSSVVQTRVIPLDDRGGLHARAHVRNSLASAASKAQKRQNIFSRLTLQRFGISFVSPFLSLSGAHTPLSVRLVVFSLFLSPTSLAHTHEQITHAHRCHSQTPMTMTITIPSRVEGIRKFFLSVFLAFSRSVPFSAMCLKNCP